MAQQRPPERERYEQRYEENGIASDMKAGSYKVKEEARKMGLFGLSPEVQGYLLIAAGSALLLFTLGFFPVLKWFVVAASAAVIALGMFRSDVIRSLSDSVERMRNRR